MLSNVAATSQSRIATRHPQSAPAPGGPSTRSVPLSPLSPLSTGRLLTPRTHTLSARQNNETFENYYKAQGIIPEAEWADFTKSLREPLPTTFRLTSSRPTAHALNDHIKKVYVPFLSGIEYEGAKLEPPKPIEWYPEQLAWQLPVHKAALRKDPHFRKFQHFLVYETDAGNLSRQEAVSMIPPLLLDVQPGMTALDMCAAPGSKSVQILEALHAPGASTDPAHQGLLIANDSDAKRCHLLVHQSLHRVPGTGMMVTNHDATQLPSLRVVKDAAAEGAAGRLKFTVEDERRVAAMSKDRVAKQYDGMLFDRILADVPCSGDGTMRKNLGIWTDWTVGNGIGLHSLQLRILLRGIQLLKPGGRLVYSTCSMNPMENESVISAALSLCPGASASLVSPVHPPPHRADLLLPRRTTDMSILPVTDELPALKRRPGLTTWRVLDNSLSDAPHPSSAAAASADAPAPPDADEAVAVEQDNDKGREGVRKGDKAGVGKKGKGKKEKKVDANGRRVWTETLWPRGDEKEKGLEHALRLYPHLQDTGAFFVCVLVKKGDAAAEAPAEAESVQEEQEVAMEEEEAPAAPVATEKRERAATPTPAEGEPEAKKVRQEEAEEDVKPKADAKPAQAQKDKKKEPVLGGGKPFNEEPYIYLPGLEDEQIRLIKCVAPPRSSLLRTTDTWTPAGTSSTSRTRSPSPSCSCATRRASPCAPSTSRRRSRASSCSRTPTRACASSRAESSSSRARTATTCTRASGASTPRASRSSGRT